MKPCPKSTLYIDIILKYSNIKHPHPSSLADLAAFTTQISLHCAEANNDATNDVRSIGAFQVMAYARLTDLLDGGAIYVNADILLPAAHSWFLLTGCSILLALGLHYKVCPDGFHTFRNSTRISYS